MRWRVAVVRRPVGEQIEQHRVVGLVAFGRMRPVAAPHHAFRRGLDVGLRDAAGLRIVRRTAEHVGARQLHPGAAVVEHPADDAERRIAETFRQTAGRDDRTRSCPAAAAADRRRRRSGRRADGFARASRAAARGRASGSIMSSVVVAVFGSNWVKRMPRTPPSASSRRLGVRDGRMHDRDAARLRAELRDRVERHRVVGGIGRRRHHHGPAGADPLLQQSVIGDAWHRAASAASGRGGGKRPPS